MNGAMSCFAPSMPTRYSSFSGNLESKSRKVLLTGSGALEDVQAAASVDQIEQSTPIAANVVAAHALFTLRSGRQEGRHLARSVRIGDVDEPKAVGEPRHGDLGAGDFLARLMAAGERRLRGAVHARYLEAREGYRTRLVGDVHQPEKSRRTRHELGDVLVADHHHAAALDREWNRQRRVGRMRERRAPVEPGDQSAMAHLLDVEHDAPAVPA